MAVAKTVTGRESIALACNVPIPIEDELALGLLGRFSRLNGMSSITWAVTSLQKAFHESAATPTTWLLARACGINAATFDARHSMLPLLYPISRYVGHTSEARTMRRRALVAGAKTSLPMLRYCPDCAQSDQENLGFSYWHRTHQIGGLDWCSKHRLVLREVPLDHAIHQPEHRLDEVGKPFGGVDVVAEATNPALASLHAIQQAWLNREQPVNIRAWSALVSQRCTELNLRRGEVGTRSVASDLILERLPISWLRRHMPEIARKQAGTFIRKVDGACIDRHVPYPSLACAAILAALFNDAAQALDALERASQRVASEVVTEGMIDQAVEAFLSGLRLKDACKAYGADVALVEARLRADLLQRAQEASEA